MFSRLHNHLSRRLLDHSPCTGDGLSVLLAVNTHNLHIQFQGPVRLEVSADQRRLKRAGPGSQLLLVIFVNHRLEFAVKLVVVEYRNTEPHPNQLVSGHRRRRGLVRILCRLGITAPASGNN